MRDLRHAPRLHGSIYGTLYRILYLLYQLARKSRSLDVIVVRGACRRMVSDHEESMHPGWRRYLHVLLALQNSAVYAVASQPVLTLAILLILVLQVCALLASSIDTFADCCPDVLC